MVDIYESEAEQVEHLKKIWREYGVATIVGVIIAITLGFGWRFYQQRHEHILEHASMRYEQLLTSVVNGNAAAVEVQANRLIDRYPHTPYAEFAALQLARQDVYQNKLADAESKLRWVTKHGDSPALREVAKVRLARVLLAEKQPQQALDVLNTTADEKAYVGIALEVKGDALLALGKTTEARAAYEAAMKAFPGFEATQPLLEMKYEDLAGASVGVQG